MDDLIKRLLASRSVWTNENGRAESKPSDLEAEAAAALSKAQATIARLEAENEWLRHHVSVVAEQATSDEILEGYLPEETEAWHRGYDAAVCNARASLVVLTPREREE
jgi:hypothetical protein